LSVAWGYANGFPDVVCSAVTLAAQDHMQINLLVILYFAAGIVETGVIALGSLLAAKPKADSTPEAPKG
jgi:hypothetical protein